MSCQGRPFRVDDPDQDPHATGDGRGVFADTVQDVAEVQIARDLARERQNLRLSTGSAEELVCVVGGVRTGSSQGRGGLFETLTQQPELTGANRRVTWFEAAFADFLQSSEQGL